MIRVDMGTLPTRSPEDRGPFFARERGSWERFTGTRAECYAYKMARLRGVDHESAVAAAIAAAQPEQAGVA